jgi:hypothetical protein
MPEFNVVPLTKTLLVEGESRRERFRGLVLAVGWSEEPAPPGAPRRRTGPGVQPPEMHYLVSDESKPAPMWVEARQITSQHWFPAVPGRGDASPAPGVGVRGAP